MYLGSGSTYTELLNGGSCLLFSSGKKQGRVNVEYASGSALHLMCQCVLEKGGGGCTRGAFIWLQSNEPYIVDL